LTGQKYIAEFDLSDECNLRCNHCYHFRGEKQFEEVPIEEWERVFKKQYKNGIRRVLLIGGEPAMRMDVVELANKTFSYIDICSNGTIRIPDWYKQKIFVSIDGNKETHDEVRGEGVYDKVINNYHDDKRVVISMTVSEHNWEQMEDVIKLAIKNNLFGVSCDVYTPSPVDFQKDALFVTPQIRKKIINEMYRLKKKYPYMFFMSNSAIRWFEKENHKNKPCYWKMAVKHFDTKLQERPSCKNLDCSNCGHFAQANLSPLDFLL